MAKRWLVYSLDWLCGRVDLLPDWTYPLVGRWIGCPSGMGIWAANLDERWRVGLYEYEAQS